MKKFNVIVPVEYVVGHLRYGHYETEVDAETEEQAMEFLKSDEGIEQIKGSDFIVDDYEVDDKGSLDMSMVTITEVENND